MEETSPRKSDRVSDYSSQNVGSENIPELNPRFTASAPQMRFGKIDDLGSRVAVAVDAARNYLF